MFQDWAFAIETLTLANRIITAVYVRTSPTLSKLNKALCEKRLQLPLNLNVLSKLKAIQVNRQVLDSDWNGHPKELAILPFLMQVVFFQNGFSKQRPRCVLSFVSTLTSRHN